MTHNTTTRAVSAYPSLLVLPKTEKPYPTILEYLVTKFPYIEKQIWETRIRDKKVLDEHGHAITLDTQYVPFKKIYYFREVHNEPVIPFKEDIVFHNDELLVSCKPHFLPVTPGGHYVNECLLHRLKKRTGLADLVPLHRIDRDTAGLVMFSCNQKTRGYYTKLFRKGNVLKTYHAVAHLYSKPEKTEWLVENRIGMGEPWFRRKVVSGTINARSKIQIEKIQGSQARFILHPLTGKTHQLRIHMSGLGFGICNDQFYPDLDPGKDDDYTKPLQLIAKTIAFRDPVNGKHRVFESPRVLAL